MGYPYYDLVQKAYSDLKAEGLIRPRDPANQQQVEEDKGLLTRRAAYYVNTQRTPSHGLLSKTSGNNSQGYSVDWILSNVNGEGWDVATDTDTNGMREAVPVDGGSHGPNPDNIPLWRPPTKELAQISDTPIPEPIPPPDGGGGATDSDIQEIKDQLVVMQNMIAQQGEMVYHMMTQTWWGTCKMGIDMEYGMTCPPMPSSVAASRAAAARRIQSRMKLVG
jgi:hypothetical protein